MFSMTSNVRDIMPSQPYICLRLCVLVHDTPQTRGLIAHMLRLELSVLVVSKVLLEAPKAGVLHNLGPFREIKVS